MNERTLDTVTYEFTKRFINSVSRKFIPNVEVKRKSEATDFKFKVARFVAVNILRIKQFDNMFQAIENTIYVPDDFYVRENHLEAIRTIAHETVHLYDRKEMGLKFSLLYLFPQILLVPFVILSLIFWNAWLLIPAFLFLLPLPAYYRAKLELRAYLVDLIWAQYVWEIKDFEHHEQWAKEKFQRHMSSGTYYFAYPFKRSLKSWYERKAARHSWKRQSPYKEIIEFLQEELEG